MGINGFCTHVYANQLLRNKILQGTYDLIAADRKASLDAASKALLIDSVKMFHTLGVYTRDFGPKVLGDSEQYLLSWAEQKSHSLNLPDYVFASHELIESETKRCDTLGLDRTTRDSLEIHILVRKSFP